MNNARQGRRQTSPLFQAAYGIRDKLFVDNGWYRNIMGRDGGIATHQAVQEIAALSLVCCLLWSITGYDKSRLASFRKAYKVDDTNVTNGGWPIK